MPDMEDEADAPIIVPPRGLIVRRTARTTKGRKQSLPGDTGGPRFSSGRRGVPHRKQTTPVESPRTSSDKSSSENGDSVESGSIHHRRITLSDPGNRPESITDVIDSYTRDEDDEPSHPTFIPLPDIPVVELPDVELPDIPEPPLLEIQPPLLEPTLLLPQPEPVVTPQESVEEQGPSRTPSPPPEPSLPATAAPQVPTPPPASTPSPPQRKDKDKKGFFPKKWGADKGVKKSPKDKDRENRERVAEKEKEKDPGFFGALFGGGSKKKSDETPPVLVSSGASGRETAQALLGASKSKSFVSPVSPALSAGIGANAYARYPIHVERAIYRLSHIKLANPRRPLYEQVLISNLMFWYLGVINKAQSSPSSPNGQAGVAPMPAPVSGTPDKEDAERKEKEQRERAEKETLERERLEREREIEMKKRESGRRGSLTKTSAHGAPSGGRRAEIPVKGPQYEMQHRVMEQEYSGYNGAQMGRSASTPANGNGNGQYSRNPQQPQSTQTQPGDYLHSPDQNQQRLPPGAMSPDQPLRQQQPRMRQHSSPSPPLTNLAHQPRSPSMQKDNQTQQNASHYINSNTSQDNLVLGGGGERLPGRSLSVNAVPSPPPPQINGRTRKGQSAHAAMPSHGRRPRTSEEQHDANGTGEEDMPLAMWQQQRRR